MSKIATERLYRIGLGGRVELAYAEGDDIREGDTGLMTLEAATEARAKLTALGERSPVAQAQEDADAAGRATGDTADAATAAEPDEHKARAAPAKKPRKPARAGRR